MIMEKALKQVVSIDIAQKELFVCLGRSCLQQNRR
jgi:hypothetical protein